MAPPSLESAKATLEAALDVFAAQNSLARPPGGRTELKALGEKAKQAASRAAILASGGSTPSAEEVSGVVYGLEQSTIAICSYTHGFTHGSGPSLKDSLKQRCSGLVEPTQELVAKLMSGADGGELRAIVGKVWAAVDELVAGPIDNKGCLFRKLADVMAGVKSAAKELEELVVESKQELAAADRTSAGSRGPAARTSTEGSRPPRSSDDEEDDAQSSEVEEDEDDFRDMGHLSASELGAAEAAAGLLAAAQEAMRAVSRPLLEGPEVTGSHCLDEWESMAWHAQKLRSSCEALVACLYPPHEDFGELLGTAESVSITLELLLSEFPEAYAGAAPAGAGAGAGGMEAAGAQAEGQQQAAGRTSDASAALEAAQQSVDAAAQRLQDTLSRQAHAARTGVATS
ncbi:hypothetical protein CHLRE_16g665550v5 [Chlamydomonas reinhardtii]|uniref:Cyclin-D1-binding protein 1-like N-terminal domain-containing protein n=1 Tax=Chlamydomonas reinhardtii TaxID=3055 RepID=A8JF81_CHLRE|nr:uncharacterized protein CHLRE_16g665550v5 [Chlamydomonas reinhardtii]XP_042915698.1 uncharacterized protein CHLRE_16g665550v5 [Chlamydomonas reinhardtii]PNW71703.1 hypothetical protein CHLRE_16g665550v5 [Chlamydomonas reinhardtii]PNW71704.1 hypothetical protein CHLRE_16g665550v5 [Chlamydomonas reinhardtii]|eukprot:XP_001701471.1 predicted protein [Chlamydomonas reinhardtii]